MELHLQKFLRSGNSLEDLNSRFGIICKRGKEYNNLIIFKYDMIDSPMGELLVQECRGIILDENDNWNIVSFPYKKFFNEGEGHAAKIDWNTASCLEKVDGSLITLYFYKSKWHVSTSGTPDASGQISGLDLNQMWKPHPDVSMSAPKSFAEYFWQTLFVDNADLYSRLGGSGNPIDPNISTEYCYMFELTGPLNRIVVVHDYASLTVLGARHLKTHQEVTPNQAAKMLGHHRPVKAFDLSNLTSIVKSFENMSPLSQEGYVVVDANFNRVKIKSPAYVALHHAKDGMNNKSFVEIVRSGEISEVLNAFPEFKHSFEEIQTKYQQLLSVVERDYESLKDIPLQKDFALAALKTKSPNALFAVRAKKSSSVPEYFRNIRLETLCDLLGVR